nr:putative late blight resistance protein homolog R1A-4 isoform X1 [Ipomoea batatas]
MNSDLSLTYISLMRYLGICLGNSSLSLRYLLHLLSCSQNLQTLIVSHILRSNEFYDVPTSCHYFSSEMWASQELSHVECSYLISLDPPNEVKEKLHTLYWLSSRHCTEEVFSRIPNDYDDNREVDLNILENLHHLNQLETLKIKATKQSICLRNPQAFPQNLKELTLSHTRLQWKHINIIGYMPSLEVLKLKNKPVCDETWEPSDGGFRRLKFLLIDYCDRFQYWEATPDHYPVLERLVIRNCLHINEIPSSFEDMITLRLIDLTLYTDSLLASAQRIQKAQQDLGNYGLAVRNAAPFKEFVSIFEDFLSHIDNYHGTGSRGESWMKSEPYLSVPQWFDNLDDVVSNNLNLQTLIVSGVDQSTIGAPTVHLPSKIWELQHLRHLELGDMYLVDPPNMVKEHLQTLVCAMPIHFRKEVYYCRFPSIRKLKILYKDLFEAGSTRGSCGNPIIILENFEDLLRLETLTVIVLVGRITLLERLVFPASLKELRLSGTNFLVKVLRVIGQLPRLRVLKLENSFYGRVWEVAEGGFYELEELVLEARNLELWVTNGSHFPNLRHIVLKCCYFLEEIPPDSAEGPLLLFSIKLEQCPPSVVTSAKWIQQECATDLRYLGLSCQKLLSTARFFHTQIKEKPEEDDQPPGWAGIELVTIRRRI